MIYFEKTRYLNLFENKTLDRVFLLEQVIKNMNKLSRYIALERTKKDMQDIAKKLMLFGEKKAYICLMLDIERNFHKQEKQQTG